MNIARSGILRIVSTMKNNKARATVESVKRCIMRYFKGVIFLVFTGRSGGENSLLFSDIIVCSWELNECYTWFLVKVDWLCLESIVVTCVVCI